MLFSITPFPECPIMYENCMVYEIITDKDEVQVCIIRKDDIQAKLDDFFYEKQIFDYFDYYKIDIEIKFINQIGGRTSNAYANG